jgi:hypothetical protein
MFRVGLNQVGWAALALTFFGPMGCKKPAPLPEGMYLTYEISRFSPTPQAGWKEQKKLSFAKSPEGHVQVKTVTTGARGRPSKDSYVLNEMLVGDPLSNSWRGYLVNGLFLPKAQRKKGGQYGAYSVQEKADFKAWPGAWRATFPSATAGQPEIEGFFHPTKGFLVGLKRFPITVSLVETNLQGVIPDGVDVSNLPNEDSAEEGDGKKWRCIAYALEEPSGTWWQFVAEADGFKSSARNRSLQKIAEKEDLLNRPSPPTGSSPGGTGGSKPSLKAKGEPQCSTIEPTEAGSVFVGQTSKPSHL